MKALLVALVLTVASLPLVGSTQARTIDRCTLVTIAEAVAQARAGGELKPSLQAKFDALKARYC